jgi:hypothetical protein
MFVRMAGRPPKFRPEAVDQAREISGGASKMAAHNEIYRQRALHILRSEIDAHRELAEPLRPLLDRPNKTILAELGRLENPRALVWQAMSVARGQPQPVVRTVAWLRAHRLAGTLHGRPPKSVTDWPPTGRRDPDDSS